MHIVCPPNNRAALTASLSTIQKIEWIFSFRCSGTSLLIHPPTRGNPRGLKASNPRAKSAMVNTLSFYLHEDYVLPGVCTGPGWILWDQRAICQAGFFVKRERKKKKETNLFLFQSQGPSERGQSAVIVPLRSLLRLSMTLGLCFASQRPLITPPVRHQGRFRTST